MKTLVLAVALTAGVCQAQTTNPPIVSLPPGIHAAPSSILQPIELTPQLEQASRDSMASSKLKTDLKCGHTSEDIRNSVIALSDAQTNSICVGEDRKILVRGSQHALYVCSQGLVVASMRIALGSNGMGKEREGDRKNPIGTYWLGLPHRSKYFGIFIPVGFPNLDDLVSHKTGSDVGIHGPNHFLGKGCNVVKALRKDWTAGCVATGRDSQILWLADWVLKNWPVQVTIARN